MTPVSISPSSNVWWLKASLSLFQRGSYIRETYSAATTCAHRVHLTSTCESRNSTGWCFPTRIQWADARSVFVALTVHIVSKSNVTPDYKKEKKNSLAGQWRTTHTWNYSCPRVRPRSENNSTFSTVFTHVSVRVDKHENPFIYKGAVRPVLDNVSFMVPLQALARPQSRPTDSTTSVIGHTHLIWTHQGRCCGGFFAVHQEECCWFTEAAICSEHKRTMDGRQMHLGRK